MTTDKLRERNFGEFQGKSKKELYAQFSNNLVNGRLDPFLTPPGGESFEQFILRVSMFYQDCIAPRIESPDSTLICSHLNVFRALTCIHRRIDYRSEWASLSFDCGVITAFQ